MPHIIAAMIKAFAKTKKHKKVLLFFGIIILIIDVLSISYFRILDRFELVTLDFRYSLRSAFPEKVNPDIAIIEIGEDTLGVLGVWPIPRDYHSSLIDALNRFGAKMIIFDILFCEPTPWDDILIASTKKAGNVYFPFVFGLQEKQQKGIPEAKGVDAPLLKGLEEASKGTGFINKLIDIDGKVRRAPLLTQFQGRRYSSLGLKIASDYIGINSDSISFDNKNKVLFGNNKIPVDNNGMILLDFAGRWADTFTHYSYIDILAADKELAEGKRPRIDPNTLKGKVCFVGLTATGTQELGPIPIENSYPMLGIHANLLNMLLEGSYLRRLSRTGNLAILITLVIGLLFLILRLRPYTAFFVSLGLIALLFIFSSLLFAFKGIWIDIVCPSIILFGAYLTMTIVRYIAEIRTREKIQKELAVAASIQRCFLPAEVPSIEGLDIAVEMKTAKEVGGDLYDFIKLDDRRLGVMIGDVSGKGVPASLFMAKVETLFKVYSKNEARPASVITKLNKEIASDERSGLFTTLIYAVFDTENRQLLLSDAGHLPAILVHEGKAEKVILEGGMAIGIMEDETFMDKNIALSEGDIVVAYTDGISEAKDLKGNEFSIERLMSLIEENRQLLAADLLKLIISEVTRFQGKAIQHDDMTIVVAKVY